MSLRPRVSELTVERARVLLAEGVSVANVAKALGISTSTAYGIKVGKRCVKAGPEPKPAKPTAPGEVVFFQANARPVWCDVCRVFVRPPCLACQIRKLKENQTCP